MIVGTETTTCSVVPDQPTPPTASGVRAISAPPASPESSSHARDGRDRRPQLGADCSRTVLPTQLSRMALQARTRTRSLRPENDLRLQLMKRLRAESIDALNRIKRTAATIYVEERRGTTWPAHARDRVDRRLATASQSLRQCQPSLRRRAERQPPEARRERLTSRTKGAMTIMDMQRRIDAMKLSLDELAAAYEILDPDKATKAILTAIVKIQLRLAQHAAGAVDTGWGDPPEEANEGESDD
jgi:hypothetical protein